MKIIIAILALSILSACDSPEDILRYNQYKKERVLGKICNSGVKIWEWNGEYYVTDLDNYPDQHVKDLSICQ